MAKKRVFIIQNTPINEPLPLSVYLTGFLRNMGSSNYELNLIVARSNSVPEEIKSKFNKIYQVESSTYSIKDNFLFSFKINSILKKENDLSKIDIIHCLYPNSSLLGAFLFKKFNKTSRLIYDIRSPWIEMSLERGFIHKSISSIYKKIIYLEEKILCKNVDHMVFISEGLKDHYFKEINYRKSCSIIPSAVDLSLFKKSKNSIRKKYGLSDKDILIGSVGGIAKIRKLHEFLPIFKKLLSKNSSLRLMFVGEGDSLKELKAESKRLNLEKNIIFVGKVSHSEVPNYISSFDFGLCHLPDLFVYRNSFPLKILEYLGCKIPVLASDLKAHRDIQKKLKGIYIYKDEEDIFKVLKKRHYFRGINSYSWDSLVKKYNLVYDKNE